LSSHFDDTHTILELIVIIVVTLLAWNM